MRMGYSSKVLGGLGSRELDIDDLQITYDLVDYDTNPANVDQPTLPNTPAQMRKVNLLLGARSHQRIQSTGGYRHETLTTQVTLRSLTFIDRYL